MQEIQNTQLELLGGNVVVLTMVCRSDSSAVNVFDTARERLLGEGLSIGPYELKCATVALDTAATRPAAVDRDPASEDGVAVCWPTTGQVQILAHCPEEAVAIIAGPRAALAHALAAVAEARDDGLYVPGMARGTAPVDAERAFDHLCEAMRRRLKPVRL